MGKGERESLKGERKGEGRSKGVFAREGREVFFLREKKRKEVFAREGRRKGGVLRVREEREM